MGTPLAFLLTFRTYGTWLHGDERGSVDRDHNTPGTPLLPPDAERLDYESAILRDRPLILTEEMRAIVDAAILDECAFRRWELLERTVRSNHVHIVVAYAATEPERMIQRLKSRATRWLRERRAIGAGRPVWADRPGSRRYLWTLEAVNAACNYVRDGQDVPR